MESDLTNSCVCITATVICTTYKRPQWHRVSGFGLVSALIFGAIPICTPPRAAHALTSSADRNLGSAPVIGGDNRNRRQLWDLVSFLLSILFLKLWTSHFCNCSSLRNKCSTNYRKRNFTSLLLRSRMILNMLLAGIFAKAKKSPKSLVAENIFCLDLTQIVSFNKQYLKDSPLHRLV